MSFLRPVDTSASAAESPRQAVSVARSVALGDARTVAVPNIVTYA